MKIISRLILVLSIFSILTASLRAQEKRPKIATSVLCGVVTDLAGEPISKATVAAMWMDFGTSNETDQSGRWSFGPGTGPHWMKVEAAGFETFLFDYVDKADPKSNGAEKPAFILPRNDGPCPTPIYVRLAPTSSNAGFVTLDSAKRIRKENAE
ncbi:MAG: carboxypeptidase-like regulatory domain-containing protein [Acidobacteriota bacterium]